MFIIKLKTMWVRKRVTMRRVRRSDLKEKINQFFYGLADWMDKVPITRRRRYVMLFLLFIGILDVTDTLDLIHRFRSPPAPPASPGIEQMVVPQIRPPLTPPDPKREFVDGQLLDSLRRTRPGLVDSLLRLEGMN